MNETCNCCVCENKFNDREVKHIEIKGKVKDICDECLTSIKGLI
jgi:hypothetical protein